MRLYDDSASTESRNERFRMALKGIAMDREELLGLQLDVLDRLAVLEKQSKHNAVMLKAMDQAILDISSYLDNNEA